MYRKNTLERNVLIMTDEVIKHGPTMQTLDPRTIESSIIIAEERFLRGALGDDFYEALIAQKNVVVTSGNLTDLQAKVNASLPTGSQAVTLVAGDIVNSIEFLTDANKELWKMYLWKLAAECVMLMAIPEGHVQFGTAGVMHNLPSSGPMTSAQQTAPDLRTVKWAMDKKLMDRIDPLMEPMHIWICKRKVSYPLYKKHCDCDAAGVAYKRKTDFVMGIYDEPDDNCLCE